MPHCPRLRFDQPSLCGLGQGSAAVFRKLFGQKQPIPAPTPIVHTELLVESDRYPGERVQVSGFHFAAASSHMLVWLGRGPDAALFVARDVELELVEQQPGSRLVSIELLAEPELVTKAVAEDGTSMATVSALTASFPLRVHAVDSTGAKWRLMVTFTYVATGLESRDARKLQQEFGVTEAHAL